MTNPQKIRRVGTVTMGLSLIATGIIILLLLIKPNFDILFLLNFAPVVLISLGIEIIINYFTRKDENLKIDFFSIFICFLLIGSSLVASAIPVFVKYFGPETYKKEEAIETSIENFCYEHLADNKYISTLRTNAYRSHEFSDTYKVQLNIKLINIENNINDFTKVCFDIVNILNKSENEFDFIRFYNSDFELKLDGKFQQNMDLETMTQLVEQD